MLGFAVTLVAVGLYGGFHSWLASQRVKVWLYARWPRLERRFYRLIYNIVAGITLLPVLAVPAFFPGTNLYRIDPPWVFVTLLIQAAGAMLILVGLLQTGPMAFLGLSQLMGGNDTETNLVVSGVYRYMRHPLYTGGMLVIWLTPLMTSSVLALNLGLSLYLYIGSIFEERKLARSFGVPYAEYQRQVPRFIPRPWRTFNP
ncbi:MAG: isoprenylcysteine carboxylmethyltransferase family protein [Anaerolineales bacterium]